MVDFVRLYLKLYTMAKKNDRLLDFNMTAAKELAHKLDQANGQLVVMIGVTSTGSPLILNATEHSFDEIIRFLKEITARAKGTGVVIDQSQKIFKQS